MNLLLLAPTDLIDHNTACVKGRQLTHLHKTLRANQGDQITVGIENGLIGKATITELNNEQALLSFECTEPAPEPLPLKLIIGLPRPKMLRRIIQTAVTMGVKDLTFINSWKVEKSYWQTPWLSDEALRENVILGLEQAKDTQLPIIRQQKLFKPFVEDELAALADNTKKLVAHPFGALPCPVALNQTGTSNNTNAACTLAIGPEGGYTEYEVSKLNEQGFESVHLGPRILRVETAVPTLIARLFPS